MTKDELKQVLDHHIVWLQNNNGKRADLSGADLFEADLFEANLSRANLSRANLSRANLSGANLSRANLFEANLFEANLSRANLSRANLSRANLSRANLSGADLSGANLSRANLFEANLFEANLSGADLSGANLSPIDIARASIVPESGQFTAWKKCRSNVLVKLVVGKNAKRSNATGRKCRAEYIKVLEVIGAEVGISRHDNKTEYRSGQIVRCDKWEENRWVECGGGIHFFLTRLEAENYE